METQYENREFMIFNTSELDKIDFTQVCETAADTVRRSTDGTRTFVKWDGETPECVTTLETAEGAYTYEEILDILSGPEWTNAEPMI